MKKYDPTDTNYAGIITGMPNDVYHSTPGFVSKSGLDLINRSPAHYYAAAAATQSKAMALGSAIHTAILEPELFASEYLLLTVSDRRTPAYKEAIKNHPADKVLTGTESDQVRAMQAAVMAHPLAAELLARPGVSEASIFTTDPVTGAQVRTRPDRLTDDGLIIDLKSSRDASPEAFAKSILNYRYHVQAALYQDAYQWATGREAAGFVFIVIESELPHNVQVYQLDGVSEHIGRQEYRRNLATYAECQRTGIWPGYSVPGADPELISLPEWAMKIEDEMEITHA